MLKRTIVKVNGGDCDGRTFDSASGEKLAVEMAHDHVNSEVGQVITGLSFSQLEALDSGQITYKDIPKERTGHHAYRIVSREEDDDAIRVTLQYHVTPIGWKSGDPL